MSRDWLIQINGHSQRFPVWWKRSILFHSTWYSWWWQVRRECSVDAVNEKPLGKSTETKCICLHICVRCLWAVQVLKLSVTCSLCAVKMILIPMLQVSISPALPRLHRKKSAGLTWNLGVREINERVGMIDPCFSGPVQRFLSEKALARCLCRATSSWVAPCVTQLDQSCGAGSQSCVVVSAVWLSC